MLGVFDSGRGGLGALCELRRILPNADIAYMADTAHLPYGSKSAEVLIPLIDRALLRLRARGCSRILIACVTASSLYDRLSKASQEIAYPIIPAVAHTAAELSLSGRVGIVATERTIREGALSRALAHAGVPPISESVGTGLVELVEDDRTGFHDADALSTVWRTLIPHLRARIDTLVLGCTHYPALAPLFRRLLPDSLTLVCSGEVGARAFADSLSANEQQGRGLTLFY